MTGMAVWIELLGLRNSRKSMVRQRKRRSVRM